MCKMFIVQMIWVDHKKEKKERKNQIKVVSKINVTRKCLRFPSGSSTFLLPNQRFFVGIPTRLERSTKRQQAEVKSLDHVFIPAEAYLNDKGHCT